MDGVYQRGSHYYPDEEIVAFVRGRYSKDMAESVNAALRDARSPVFADHVRRSFSREMAEDADDGA
jgi:hypothetical protein